MFYHFQKKLWTKLSHHVLPHPHPHPCSSRQLWVYFLSLKICLFWTSHINRIIQYLVFCDQLPSISMFLSFNHVVASVFHFFLLGTLFFPLSFSEIPTCFYLHIQSFLSLTFLGPRKTWAFLAQDLGWHFLATEKVP